MTQIIGIDFSGSQIAGRKIWIACGVVRDGKLKIETVQRSTDLPSGNRLREAALIALRQFIVGQSDAIIGLDFPFSLPRELIKYPTWETFLSQFATDYPSAREFKQHCKAATETELRRKTDEQAKTPFSPYNLWLFCQTFYGIRDVLAPLIQQDRVRIVPMQQAIKGKPTLLEICPASTIRSLTLGEKYKGNKPDRKQMREIILDKLATYAVEIPKGLREMVIADNEGDALDSIIAAMTVRDFTMEKYVTLPTDHQHYLLEGFVYFSKPQGIN